MPQLQLAVVLLRLQPVAAAPGFESTLVEPDTGLAGQAAGAATDTAAGAAGLEAAVLEVAGLEAAGLEVAGLEAAGLEAA